MNLLITGAWGQATEYIEQLSKKHYIVFLQWEKNPLPCEYEWVEGIIGNGIFLSHPIEKFTNLRFIQLTSVGYDRVPMDYVKEHGIEIHNAKGVYSIPMAEFAVAGVLQLCKQSLFFMENQKNRRWQKHRGLLELSGKTVCIIGCGDVGNECAKRFRAFGCEVIGVNRTVREDPIYEHIYSLDYLQEAIKVADVIILTIALTDKTRHLVSKSELQKMKDTAILVNLARGAIIDTEALIERLPRIGGAVLDVFEEEPLSQDSVLWEMENVIITPHNSFVGEGNGERISRVILENLREG